MSENTPWTDEEVQKLRVLWDEGHSTAAISKMIGRSRNAVIGKTHRLDFPKRPTNHVPSKPRIWNKARNAVLTRDYPAGEESNDIKDRLNKLPGAKVTIQAISAQTRRLGLKRPRWFISEQQRRQRYAYLAEIRSQRAAPVIVLPAPPKAAPAPARPGSFPVQRFSMLGGTIRR